MPPTQIVRFRPTEQAPAENDGYRYGVVVNDHVEGIEDPFADPAGPRLITVGPSFDLTAIELGCPCRPTKIICIGRNYKAHAAEMQQELPKEPMLFLKPPSALAAHGQAIRLPMGVGRVDYEGELVLVIGRRTRKIEASAAAGAIFGLTCGIDVSARALQKADGQWGRAKGFDSFAPTGSAIAVDVDPRDLELVTRVNREERQRARTSTMMFGPYELVSFVSRVMTLEPGDLIFTGTPSGVGELSPGDEVEVSIENVGMLRCPVVADGEAGR